jgi:UDP-N-acetylglucosamine 2-epimerase (non-hydrolysing)/GDP/UDP-N,N'-diacetylbacillosamine 2-epimerase (hydrolysing)
MSHVHLAPTATAAQRLLDMGEEEWRVHQVGAPSLDHLRRSPLPDRDEIERELDLTLGEAPVVVATHPVTLARNTTREADALFEALAQVERPLLFCFPNSDAGGHELIERSEAFCSSRADARLFVNLEPALYWSLLQQAAVLVGNSSSGIMEAPSLALPVVNIGMRQQGRERAPNIIDVEPDAAAIVTAIKRALDSEFRASLDGLQNPYGDGDSAARIVRILESVPLGEELLLKRARTVAAPPLASV